MTDYVSLHTHTDRSHLDGYQSVEDLAGRAKELRQASTAITDHGEVGGHLAFQRACLKNDVKPIFGMEGYLAHSIDQARADKLRPSDFSHITLLAKDNDGLANLWRWSTEAYETGFYHRPLADWASARQYAEGIAATDGCLLSFMAKAIIDDDIEEAHRLVGMYLDIFGDDFYIELHTWQIIDAVSDRHRELNAQMTKVNHGKIDLARQYGIPLIVVNDAHYAREEDGQAHQLVWEMSTGGGKKTQADQTGSGLAAAWVMGDEEVVHWMSQHGVSRSVTEEAIANTAALAESCNAEIRSELRMPRLTKTSRDDMQMFINKVEDGFRRKVVGSGVDEDLYFKRAQREMRTITSLDFHGYFNVVADYTKHAKHDRKMLVGPGRGSGSGSLVAWLMDITEVDPIKYDLLFDRFISPNRGRSRFVVELDDGTTREIWSDEKVKLADGTEVYGSQLEEGIDLC